MIRKIRKRIYLAVEGESEQSFIKFLQHVLDQNNIHAHLDCAVLGGGGYETMLKKAIIYRARKEKSKGNAKISILIVDTDRADTNEDGWSLEQLVLEAKKNNFAVCLQRPNLEGLLLRMLSENERSITIASSAHKKLLAVWKDYQKPADARVLINKFSGEDLIRTAKYDSD